MPALRITFACKADNLSSSEDNRELSDGTVLLGGPLVSGVVCIVDIADASSCSFSSLSVDRMDLIPECVRPVTLLSVSVFLSVVKGVEALLPAALLLLCFLSKSFESP